ncbi:hypothetical protein AX16_005002 [Volvariella volvacea WC 439]|nr:hypothetical protein AX16_005002 [Volvariella volvacea WC 439]
MRYTTTSVLTGIGLLAHGVAAKPAFLSSHFPRALLARQGGAPELPAECQEACGPVAGLLSGTTECTPETCCTDSFANSYLACFQCVGNSVGVTDFTEPQQQLDAYIVSCFQEGIPVPILTLPGQDPGRPLPTGSASESQSESATSSPSSSSTESESESQTSASRTQSTVTSLPTDDNSQPEGDNNAGSRLRAGFVSDGWLGSVGLVGTALIGGAMLVL